MPLWPELFQSPASGTELPAPNRKLPASAPPALASLRKYQVAEDGSKTPACAVRSEAGKTVPEGTVRSSKVSRNGMKRRPKARPVRERVALDSIGVVSGYRGPAPARAFGPRGRRHKSAS